MAAYRIERERALDTPGAPSPELRTLARAGDREARAAVALASLADGPHAAAPNAFADAVMARVTEAPPPVYDREPAAQAMVGAAVVLWTVALVALHQAAPSMGEGAQVLLDGCVAALNYGLHAFNYVDVLLEPAWLRWASSAVARMLLFAGGAAVTVGALCYHYASTRSTGAV